MSRVVRVESCTPFDVASAWLRIHSAVAPIPYKAFTLA